MPIYHEVNFSFLFFCFWISSIHNVQYIFINDL